MEEKFDVGCHPTFLIIDADGKLLSKSTGAGETEAKFIDELKYCLDKNNFIDHKKKEFENGTISPKAYYDYTQKMGLRSEMSKALDKIFLEHSKAKTLDQFVKTYMKFDPMVYYNNVNSELFDYMSNNKDQIIADGVKADEYSYLASSPINNCIEKMLSDFDYDQAEFDKVSKLAQTVARDKKVCAIQLEAVKAGKTDGLKGIIAVFEKNMDKLNESELFSLNLLIVRNYGYSAKALPFMREYLVKCMEKSPKRGKRDYGRLIN